MSNVKNILKSQLPNLSDAEAERVAKAIDDSGLIRKKADLLHNEENEYERSHDEKRKEFNKRWVELQKICSHPDTTYYPDPSGNNDSSTICNVCGKEAKRLCASA